MITLEEIKTLPIEQQYAELIAKKAELENQEKFDVNLYNRVLNTLSEIELEMSRQQREVKQQETIESVDEMELPYDFNEIFDNLNANDLIRNLLKDQYQKLFAQHNQDIAELHKEIAEKLRAADERERQLQYQNAELQNDVSGLQEKNKDLLSKIDELTAKLSQEIDLRKDAEQKRDAAADEIERLNGHISDLREQVANAPAPKAAIDISPSASLDELVKKAKESSAQKAARALDRWSNMMPDVVAPPIGNEVQPFRKDTEVESSDNRIPEPETEVVKSEEAFQAPSGEPSGDTEMVGDTPISQDDRKGSEIEDMKADIEKLKADVHVLKLRNGMVA